MRGRGNKNKLYIKSAALQTNMRSSSGLTLINPHYTRRRGKVCFCVVGVCACVLSAAGQSTQRGVAVQAAVRFRRHGGVTAGVSGLSGHGWDIIGRGGRGGGGRGLRGAVDHCCTCAAKNTRQRIGFNEIHQILPLSGESHLSASQSFHQFWVVY